MGMADPRPSIPQTSPPLVLRLQREDPPDPELTCQVCCSRQPVEWSIEWQANGVRIWTGLHDSCRRQLLNLSPEPDR